MTLATTTRLEAVNMCLSVIGEAPVATLDGTQPLDVANAEAVLDEVNREVQESGWKFNTRYNWPLAKDADGYIDVPGDTLRVTPMPGTGVDFAMEGTRLFNRKLNTDVWTVSPLKVEIVFYREFTAIPQAARQYIALRAARRFAARFLTSDNVHQFSAEDEARARAALVDAESATSYANILTGNYDVARTLQYRR